jgi:taurine--2-oxoglutarate transaminase
LGCLDVLKNKETGELIAPYNAAGDDLKLPTRLPPKCANLVCTHVWGYIFIAPPLCVTKDQIDEGLAIIGEALKISDAALV